MYALMTSEQPTPETADQTTEETDAYAAATARYEARKEEMREQLMARRAERKAVMTDLCKDLKEQLDDPSPFAGALERQVCVLDRLLYAVMRASLRDDIEKGHFNDDNLVKALRIQKQCVDTVKAVSVIEYMKAIGHASHRLPSPRKKYDRNE